MQIVISLLGGLGLFLYGMNLMGESLEKVAGSKMKKIIELLTKNIFMGVLLGAVVTAVIQSSSATTVMVVGFVNAGLMGLPQAVGVIMGANIGTTVTAQIVSFDLTGMAPLALGIGILLYLFAGNEKYKQVGEVFIGFGLLFTGMESMKLAVSPLAEYKGFTDLLSTFGRYPILGLLLGFGITAIIQSSSAAMGMLVVLASQGLVPLSSALPILYGQNIGTCVTSLISSIGANKNAKRAALKHLCFNVIGTLLFMFILNKPITMIVTRLDPTDISRQIANSHTLFNLINVVLLLPFSKYIVKLAMLIIPDKGQEEDNENRVIKYLDERMLETPSIAFGNTIKEVLRMGKNSKKSLVFSMDGLLKKSQENVNMTFEKEKIVNEQQRKILDYLIKLSNKTLDDKMRFSLDLLFHTVNDIERVGDLSENIAELAQWFINGNIELSDSAKDEIVEIYNKVLECYNLSLNAMKENNTSVAKNVLKLESEVDMLEKAYKNKHMERINYNSCGIDAGIIYLDLLTNLERISDHCASIAKRVIKINE